MLSGNAADDGETTCLAAVPLMLHDFASVPAFALCDREIRNEPPFERKTEDTLHHGGLIWVRLPAITPVFPLRVVVVTVPPLVSASSWTAPPGPMARRIDVREIREGLAFVVSPEVSLKFPFLQECLGLARSSS